MANLIDKQQNEGYPAFKGCMLLLCIQINQAEDQKDQFASEKEGGQPYHF